MRLQTIVSFLTAAAMMVGASCLEPGRFTLHADERSQALVAEKVAALVAQDEARLLEMFKDLHAHPELGFQEVQTAALVAGEFKRFGIETYTGIGKTGVVGILKNGPGPVVMFRSDMDAL